MIKKEKPVWGSSFCMSISFLKRGYVLRGFLLRSAVRCLAPQTHHPPAFFRHIEWQCSNIHPENACVSHGSPSDKSGGFQFSIRYVNLCVNWAVISRNVTINGIRSYNPSLFNIVCSF